MNVRVLLIGNYLPDEQKSMAAFAEMLADNLGKELDYVELIKPEAVLLPAKIKKPNKLWKWVAYIDKFIIFPFLLRKKSKDFDVIHICDHSNAMYAFWLQDKPTVVTCHDVIAIEAALGKIPGWQVGLTGKLFQKYIFTGLNKVDEVVCVSSYTKQHLVDLGWHGQSISVALNALNADFFKMPEIDLEPILQKYGIAKDTHYLLHVGSNLPRKNRIFVLQVLKGLREQLPTMDFKVCFIGPELDALQLDYAEKNNISNFVSVISDVTHEVLNAFYSGAYAFLFPSLFEGFGWPVIEAQSCECAVFASNRSPMTEVGGNGALYFDPDNVDEAVKLIVNSLPNLQELSNAGKKNIERFTLKNMLEAYLSAYQQAIKRKKL